MNKNLKNKNLKNLNINIKKESKIIHNGLKRYKDLDTGEIIEASEVIKKVERNGFMITYLSAIINLIDSLGNKKMQIVKYILKHMEKSNNTLIITTKELSEKIGVSTKTVVDTLKILENAGIIKRRTGAIMIHSDLIHRGSSYKEKALLTRFEEF